MNIGRLAKKQCTRPTFLTFLFNIPFQASNYLIDFIFIQHMLSLLYILLHIRIFLRFLFSFVSMTPLLVSLFMLSLATHTINPVLNSLLRSLRNRSIYFISHFTRKGTGKINLTCIPTSQNSISAPNPLRRSAAHCIILSISPRTSGQAETDLIRIASSKFLIYSF